MFGDTPHALRAVEVKKRAKHPQSVALLEEIACISVLRIPPKSLIKGPVDTSLRRISMSTSFFEILIAD